MCLLVQLRSHKKKCVEGEGGGGRGNILRISENTLLFPAPKVKIVYALLAQISVSRVTIHFAPSTGG